MSWAQPGVWLPALLMRTEICLVFSPSVQKMVLFRCKTILIPSVLDKFQIDFFQSQIINNCMKCANQFLVFVLRQSIAKITKFCISSTYALKINTGRLLHIVWMLNVYCASFKIYSLLLTWGLFVFCKGSFFSLFIGFKYTFWKAILQKAFTLIK